jgi:hypothetical protein
MKSSLTSGFCAIAASLVMSANLCAVTILDNFSDLEDTSNPAWTHLNAFIGSSGQAWNASTGQYRLTAPNNGAVLSGVQYGFVGSQTGPVTTDATVTADFVQNETGVGFGVATRLNGLNGAFNTAGRTQGYVYAYEPLSRGGLGEMAMYKFGTDPFNPLQDMGDPAGVEGVDWIRKVTLDVANKDYTFLVTTLGNTITGTVTEIGSGLVVAKQSHTDSTYASGVSGIVAVGATQGALALPADITIDNFRIQEIPEPATILLVGYAAGAMLAHRRRLRSR